MRNLEAKFPLSDLTAARERAIAIGYVDRGILFQRDTFFRVASGKLKLREEPAGAWLIHYGREERATLQLSNYEIVPIAQPARTRAVLSAALGVIAEVNKHRTLLMRANVRLHLDRVEHLGQFGELEAVIADGDDPERSRGAIDETLAALGIRRAELIDRSYFEMMSR